MMDAASEWGVLRGMPMEVLRSPGESRSYCLVSQPRAIKHICNRLPLHPVLTQFSVALPSWMLPGKDHGLCTRLVH